jgi:hypothetical protein
MSQFQKLPGAGITAGTTECGQTGSMSIMSWDSQTTKPPTKCKHHNYFYEQENHRLFWSSIPAFHFFEILHQGFFPNTSHVLRAGCAPVWCAISTDCRCLLGTWWAPVAALHIKCRTASIGTGGPATKRPPETDRVLATDTINRVGFWMLPRSGTGSWQIFSKGGGILILWNF